MIMADSAVVEVPSDAAMATGIAPDTATATARTALTAEYADIDFEVEEIQFVPKGETVISGEEVEQFEKLLDLLNKCEDVQNVYHDAKYE